MRCLASIALLLLAVIQTAPAFADNLSGNSLQTPYNWQQEWGTINFAGTTPDTGIDSANLQPKADIKRTIQTSGTQTTDLSSLGVYSVDLDNDGNNDFVLDGSAYFPRYQNPSSAVQICNNTDGCFVSLYLAGQNTYLTSGNDDKNTKTTTKYNTRTIFSDQVLAWNIILASTFESWATGTSYQLYNANPVFVTKRNNALCYNDELALNNNQCIKYLQYVGDYNSGALVDLYNYNGASMPLYDTRFTYSPFNRATAHKAPGITLGSGFGHRLNDGGTIDIQFKSFIHTYPDGHNEGPRFESFHIENHSGNDVFVPTNTDREFCSFINSNIVQTHSTTQSDTTDSKDESKQSKVDCGPEQVKFTDWIGDMQCPALVTAPTTIAAQRFCISSTSDYRPCQACIDAKVPSFELGCTFTQQCAPNGCLVSGRGNSGDPALDNGQQQYIGQYVSLAECNAEAAAYNGQVMHSAVGSYPHNYWLLNNYWQNVFGGGDKGAMSTAWCEASFNFLCANGHLCLARDTQIALPDGTSKRIDELKVGDTVLGFATTTSAVKPYKVATIAVTPKQDMVNINETLRITPNHRVIVAGGKERRAVDLKIGDELVKADGKKVKITSVATVAAEDTVYNLVLEKSAIGFVANGLRVTSYDH